MTDEDFTVEDDDAEIVAPQNPGDPGYEPPAILTELDGKGGTIFKIGEDGEEFDNLADAEEARAQLVTDHAEALGDEVAEQRERDE